MTIINPHSAVIHMLQVVGSRHASSIDYEFIMFYGVIPLKNEY